MPASSCRLLLVAGTALLLLVSGTTGSGTALTRSASRAVVVDSEGANGRGRGFRGCLNFFAGFRDCIGQGGGAGGGGGFGVGGVDAVVEGVEVAVEVATVVSERTLQQFQYNDMRHAVQLAEKNLQTIWGEGSGDLARRLDEQVWTVLKQSVVQYEVLMRMHAVHYAERTDKIEDISEVEEILEELREFIDTLQELPDAEAPLKAESPAELQWRAHYRKIRTRLNRIGRVLTMAMEMDNNGKCLFWLCTNYCGVRNA